MTDHALSARTGTIRKTNMFGVNFKASSPVTISRNKEYAVDVPAYVDDVAFSMDTDEARLGHVELQHKIELALQMFSVTTLQHGLEGTGEGKVVRWLETANPKANKRENNAFYQAIKKSYTMRLLEVPPIES